MSFAEYAALARQLAELRPPAGRAGVAGRRRNLAAAADHLERRLTAQGERLDQLGRAIGQPPAIPPPTGATAAPGRPGVGAYAQVGEAPAEVDPAVELELARRCADEADRYGQRAELLARRPALLPAWSPAARAAVVHLAAAGIVALVLIAVVLIAGAALRDAGWLVAGAPVVGWLVLRRWGRPALTGPDDGQRAVLTRAALTSRAKRTSKHG
ncbi:hypothetical protein GA0070609_1156 [Micromonospora echinaurantiaca]|uniref:Uncharacterized protein n=1 Tax=Micromonospora echinaurantiaca TaxID=47857 RepID=A0A1C5HA23_9ACTN|nr:hypothetical protein [Micromonospora echinaurantiaca]SCG42321.1 hypothetical protein GA0070609_1156 [Micromonospora echinaurantiaca]